MKARLPEFDFSQANPRWIPAAPAFAHQLNGASLLLPYLEPYLVKVMRAARPRVAEVAPELLEDLDVFNQQEANHYRVHSAYNRVMLGQYPSLAPFEAEIRADFEGFLRDRPLAWNLAYCEGFESSGVIASEFFLHAIDDLLETADPAVSALWRWHLAEEFEHRNVAHDVLKALFPGWRHRLRGFRFCSQHLFQFTARVRAHMSDIDRAEFFKDTEDAGADAKFRRRAARFHLPRIARVYMPWYSPHGRRMGEPTRRALAFFETHGLTKSRV
ncbi:metal-dependent hydrolase [Myxococcota bacterium]|nr:metal-dependent hydrolase [Myxococcota bacterium]